MDNDRRQYQRITTDHSIQLMDGDRILPALALDVSLLGMQLLCDSATAECISRRLNEGDEEIRVRIPHPNGGVDAWCRVVYLRNDSEDECRLGLEYTQFLGGSYDWLENFVDEGGFNNAAFAIRKH
ncbi:MAG TPA: PilZ domain-containing protein [Gammaproteobacteria bacterium]|nr:PilZ domain-containing protein [Gammaproteobacteria bacterium]